MHWLDDFIAELPGEAPAALFYVMNRTRIYRI